MIPMHPKQLYDAQEGKCFYCDNHMNAFSFESRMNLFGWTKDHFVPKSYKAFNSKCIRYNLVLSCQSCNSKKSNTFPTKRQVEKFRLLMSRLVRGAHDKQHKRYV